MAKPFLVPILLPVLTSAPGSPAEGWLYYNSTDHTLYVRTNSAWVDALSTSSSPPTFLSIAKWGRR